MFLWLLLLTVFVTAGWFPSVSYSQQVRISYSGVSGQNLPFWVTYEAGLYKKYGLDAEMVLISGGLTNIQALQRGQSRRSVLGDIWATPRWESGKFNGNLHSDHRSFTPARPCSPASTSAERTAHRSPDAGRE